MTTIFHSMDEIRKRLPDTARLIEDENKMQYPDAKFMVGGIMSMSEDQDTQDLIVYFDVGNPKMVLWVWCPLGNEEDGENLDDSFIDEYYEVSIEDATTNYCSAIYNEKKD
jgi:hypothetical protein